MISILVFLCSLITFRYMTLPPPLSRVILGYECPIVSTLFFCGAVQIGLCLIIPKLKFFGVPPDRKTLFISSAHSFRWCYPLPSVFCEMPRCLYRFWPVFQHTRFKNCRFLLLCLKADSFCTPLPVFFASCHCSHCSCPSEGWLLHISSLRHATVFDPAVTASPSRLRSSPLWPAPFHICVSPPS